MQVVIVWSADAAPASDARFRAFRDEVSALGYRLAPMHASARDPELARYLLVEVADAPSGERLGRALRPLPGVDSVYLKPADSLC